MKRLFGALALAIGLAVVMPVRADAPIEGPDKQYDNFTASDKEITDRFTHLAWERPSTPYPAAKTFAEAVAYCANGARRLPSLKELLTLVDEEPHLEYEVNQNTPRMIDFRAFSKTPAEPFWTSSPRGTAFITVDFKDGTTGQANAGDARRVRCVTAVP